MCGRMMLGQTRRRLQRGQRRASRAGQATQVGCCVHRMHTLVSRLGDGCGVCAAIQWKAMTSKEGQAAADDKQLTLGQALDTAKRSAPVASAALPSASLSAVAAAWLKHMPQSYPAHRSTCCTELRTDTSLICCRRKEEIFASLAATQKEDMDLSALNQQIGCLVADARAKMQR